MKRIKKIWEQLFGDLPYPPHTTLCQDILYRALCYREDYMRIVFDVENHRISNENDQVEVLTKVEDNIRALHEMLLQFRNLLHCVSHEPIHRKELNSLIEDVQFDYERVATEIDLICDDFDRLYGHLLWTMGCFPTAKIRCEEQYYVPQNN